MSSIKRFRREGGFTILEMLIVLLISTIVITVLATVLATSFRLLRSGETRAQLQGTARNALDYVAASVETAALIPLADDRDYNFKEDAELAPDGFGIDAEYVVGFPDPSDPDIHWYPAGAHLSEAWMDRIVVQHKDEYFTLGGSLTRPVTQQDKERTENMTSFSTSLFRLYVPARDNMIYYLSDEAHNRQYTAADVFFPHTFGAFHRTESFILTHTIALEQRAYTQANPANPNAGIKSGTPQQIFPPREDPVAGNITRIQFEYFHRVPVWLADPTDPADAYMEDSNDNGDVDSPVLTGWMLRPIDVADNSKTFWSYEDIYRIPADVDDFNSWNIEVFYNEPDPDDPQNAPFDFYGYLSSGNYESFRFDVEDLIGYDNSYALEPGYNADFGNCDGIPDGDGVPDNPVPGWWLPYIKAIRITIVATPSSVIEERVQASGVRRDINGNPVYYNPDEAIPYADSGRSVPLTTAKTLYIGDGKDVVVSRMVYPEFVYRLNPVVFPDDQSLAGMRRADYNYSRGLSATFSGTVSPIDEGKPTTRIERYYELEAYEDRN
jgi:type II secretory pathway pseudopilin PulG